MLRSALFIIAFVSQAWAYQAPKLSGPIVDEAHLISWRAADELSRLLRDLNAHGRMQLQVLTIPSLEGESIEQVSIQVVDQWKLGTKEKDNGILFLIAAQDRALRIEVGQGLEGELPDVFAKRIIEDLVVPLFRSGDFDQGVRMGVLAIVEKADPAYFAELKKSGLVSENFQRRYVRRVGRDSPLADRGVILVALFLFLLMIFVLPRRAGLYGRGGGWGGPGGWGGGSGGWSGGGGGFSGGGASGRW